MPKLNVTSLVAEQTTLLMPLWARAEENRHPAALLRDDYAESIVAQLDFPFQQFEEKAVRAVDYCLRASVFDQLVTEYLDANPEATIVELGVGLDTRSKRIDNGRAHWIGLDFPEVIKLRNQVFLESERFRSISQSLLDPDWFVPVQQMCGSNVLFTLEGVLYFFSKKQVIQLLKQMADQFPNAGALFDVQSPWFLAVSNWRHPLKDSRLQFSLANPKRLQYWDSRFHVEKYVGFGDSPYYDKGMSRLSRFRRWGRKLFPPARHLFKVVHLGW
jgi:O-methyltransferase involved in polyketide biosynthesis